MRTVEDRQEALQAGADAESLVARELVLRDWTILDRNWRGAGAEIDLIAERDGAVRFVEVKARSAGMLSEAVLESIGASKRRKLVRAAQAWLTTHPEPKEVAFLVALVDLEAWTVELIDDAFDT